MSAAAEHCSWRVGVLMFGGQSLRAHLLLICGVLGAILVFFILLVAVLAQGLLLQLLQPERAISESC